MCNRGNICKKDKVSVMDKPELLRIVLKIGTSIDHAKIQINAPQIAGFLPIETPNHPHMTTYIALDNIAMLTVLNEDVCSILGAFPVPKVKIKRDPSL